MSQANGLAGKVRFGLIGCGDIGQLRAAAIVQAGHELAVVSDVEGRRAAAIGGRYGALIDRDWRTLLARDSVDAVVVSTPPALHEAMCIEALEVGKHVLCEKPLARTPAECRRIVQTAQRAGRTLATGFNYRFYPSFRAARTLLRSGRIGDLSHIRSYAGYSAADHSQAWVHDPEVVGGGALHDIGIHLIDLTRYFLGEVEEVKGFACGGVWRFANCEDNGFALLRSVDGRIATLHASWTEWVKYQFRLELIGSHGCIAATCFPMRLEAQWSDTVGGRMRRIRQRFAAVEALEHLRSYRWVVVKSLALEVDAFARRLRGDATEVATGVDGLRAVEIAWSAANRTDDEKLEVARSSSEERLNVRVGR